MRTLAFGALAVSACLSLAAAAMAPQAGAQQEATAQPPAPTAIGAKLQGLDKITARIFAFDAPFGEMVSFGYLQIKVDDCIASAEDEVPERTAFLEVVEAKPDRDPVKVFSGWMFASSPSVSAMEHPVYDVWVVGCASTRSRPRRPVSRRPGHAASPPPGARDDIRSRGRPRAWSSAPPKGRRGEAG